MSACGSPGGGGEIYVALACGIKGLEGNATGASISIDIAKPHSLGTYTWCSMGTVWNLAENAVRIQEVGIGSFFESVERSVRHTICQPYQIYS